jgi:hypothetical protein
MSTKKTPARMRIAATQEEIAARAYQLYLDRNGESGDALADWLNAEGQLTKERAPRRRAVKNDPAAVTAPPRSASRG